MTPEVPGWTALSPAPPVMVRSGTDCFQIYRVASKGQGTRKGRETPWPFGEEPTPSDFTEGSTMASISP